MNNSKRIIFNVIFVLVSLIATLLFRPSIFEEFDSEANFILSILALLNVIVFWFTTKRYFYSWIRYDTLFLIGFLIVHFQIPFLESIGIGPDDPSYIWINKKVVNYATWLSLTAILMWIFGFLIFLVRKKKNIREIKPYVVDTQKLDIFLAVLFFLFVGLVGKDFLGGAYDGGDNWGEGASYAFLLLSVTLYLKIIYFFQNSRFEKISLRNFGVIVLKNKFFTFIFLSYSLIFLLAGDRGPLMEIAIVFFGAYSIYQRKISFYSLIGLVFLGATIFTIISLGRTDDIYSKSGNIINSGYKNFAESGNTFNPTNELANSNRILFRAIDAVPSQYPYVYGYLMMGDMLGVVPFGGKIRNEISEVPVMYKSSAHFFSYLGQGQFLSYGEGTEIIADIYINFGLYGVILLMTFFGYIISYLSYNAFFIKDHNKTILYLLILMGAIYINRSNFLDPLKLIFYGYLIDKFLTKKKP